MAATGPPLAEQVILVTGSSSGIGAAIVRQAAMAGARVVVNSRSSREAGEALAAELGEEATYLQADVSDEAQARELVERSAERWGRLDHVINNAGTTRVIPHADLDAAGDEVWRRILDVNLMGTWYVSRAAVPWLRRQRGSLVNVTSIAGVRPTGSSIPYAVSKAAINHLTLLLANVLGPEIRVNAVAPGLIATPWTEDWTDAHERVSRTAPLQRSGTPEDVAATTLGLLSSPYTTGQVVLVDGGLSLRG